jgi:predicted amino acid racemase
MPAPRIEIELDKLAHNARKLTALYGSKGICVTAVTKGVCGSPRIASALLNSGIRSFGDSRIANIQKMREAGLDAQFILIRSPMPSEVEWVDSNISYRFIKRVLTPKSWTLEVCGVDLLWS